MDVIDLRCCASIRIVDVKLILTAVVTVEIQLAVKGMLVGGISTVAAVVLVGSGMQVVYQERLSRIRMKRTSRGTRARLCNRFTGLAF